MVITPSITSPEIAIIQKVSVRTIERDFDWLKDRGIIRGKNLGLMVGGLLVDRQLFDPNLALKVIETPEMSKIGRGDVLCPILDWVAL